MADAVQITPQKTSPNVPRWLVRTIWIGHRALYRLTGGRFGLRPATAKQWGTLKLTSTGRRTGNARVAIIGFIKDGPNLVTPAMNGWADAEPAWWLNLQSNPRAAVVLPDGSRREIVARAAVGEERARLWRALVDLGSSAYTDANAALRSRETAIAVLEPRG
jgi:deazaflavin-dependent oxidoreductase (nitroreductase family)